MTETTRPAAMPSDTPDYMAPAWYGCMSWAIDNDEIRSLRQVIIMFVKWVNDNVWGPMV